MAYSLISTKAGTFGGSGGTTGTVDTSGADLLVVGVNYHGSFTGATPLSDSKGNTWTLMDSETGNAAGCRLYWCTPGSNVGTGHTFSTTTGYSNIFAYAFSGSRTATSPADQNSSGTANASAVASGSITPTANNCLVISVYGGFNPGTTPSITTGGTGFTIPTGFAIPTSTSEAGGAAYKIQTTAAAENTTWTAPSGAWSSCIIGSFFEPASGGGAVYRRLGLLGVGQ